MAALSPIVHEACSLMMSELSNPAPCVARSSVIMDLLQERLFAGLHEPLQAAVERHLARFQELLVQPAAAKLGKCIRPQDKVIAIAKFLRGKLAKAPAHKQPLHTQYLPSALKETGKRQLDCLGIATAVLALCQQVAVQQPEQHNDLASAVMMVSDDHCWLALPQGSNCQQQQQQQQQQHQWVQVEVTDPKELQQSQLAHSWLYAGGQGKPCSLHQVVMILVAGLMPEELKDDSAADALRNVQMHLLQQLSEQHPHALFYSNHFRWGMLYEEQELKQLAAAAESSDVTQLLQLAMLQTEQLQSQGHYQLSVQHSSRWQWHPWSCAAFGWLNRMQAALCGNTDKLLALTQPLEDCAVPHTAIAQAAAAITSVQQQPSWLKAQQTQQQHVPKQPQQQARIQQVQPQQRMQHWLDIGTLLYRKALLALQGCIVVLRQYSGCAGKPDKSSDQQLLEAVRDLWQNLADATKAVACLQQLYACATPAAQPAATLAAAAGPAMSCIVASSNHHQQQHVAHVPEIAPGTTGHTVHLAAAVTNATADSQLSAVLQLNGVISNSSWLLPQIEFMDALLCYFDDDSADVPAAAVSDFLAVAGTFSSAARVQALHDAAARQALQSSRLQALTAARGGPGPVAWQEMGVELQQMMQMPGSRKRRRKE